MYKYAWFVDYRNFRGFVKKVADRVGKSYSEFIDLGLYKSRFSLRLLRSTKEDRVKRPAVSSVKQGYRKLEDYLNLIIPKSGHRPFLLKSQKRMNSNLSKMKPP